MRYHVGADWSAGFKPTFTIALGEGVKRDVTGGVNLASRVFWGSSIGQTELVLESLYHDCNCKLRGIAQKALCT